MNSILPYRPNVCILLFNSRYELFLGERINAPGAWQFPQGGVEPTGSIEDNVLREIEEETGITPGSVRIEKQLDATNTYDFQIIPDYAIGRWRGQSQTFWLVRFLGVDSEISLDRHEPEFRNWRWANPVDVPLLAEPRRVAGYEGALKEFERFLR